jgi:hypothetical protein
VRHKACPPSNPHSPGSIHDPPTPFNNDVIGRTGGRHPLALSRVPRAPGFIHPPLSIHCGVTQDAHAARAANPFQYCVLLLLLPGALNCHLRQTLMLLLLFFHYSRSVSRPLTHSGLPTRFIRDALSACPSHGSGICSLLINATFYRRRPELFTHARRPAHLATRGLMDSRRLSVRVIADGI